MKKLPISIQDFAKLRSDNCVYADKTALIYKILTDGRQYFLSRPRRFGKSMTISTIKEIFEGNKKLFARQNPEDNDLWIYDKWDWSKTNPVIHIPFARLDYKDLGLENVLINLFKEIAKKYDVFLEAASYGSAFDELIKKLNEKHGRVVILIDEYDKPIIDFLESSPDLSQGEDKYPIAHKNREKLRNLYACIKDNDSNIELFFMTGVSKFSQTGVFSHLNHLSDITLHDDFVNLVGITPSELLEHFGEYIDATAAKMNMSEEKLLSEIKLWYNGYSWDGENTVYNPFSLINFFSHKKFQDYWFQTGSPKFLIDLIKEKKSYNFNNIRVTAAMVHSYEIENLDLRTLFFQTGYLTIKKMNRMNGFLTLDYPNREVEQSMANHLMATMRGQDLTESATPVLMLEDAFLKNNVELVVKVIKTMLRDIPAILFGKQKEAFYHALVHLHFKYLGWLMESEVHTSDGRMDAVIKTNEYIYIFEFKIDTTAAEAIEQINEKNYADKYALENKKIVGVGINFSTKKRTIDDWQKVLLN